MSIRDHVTNHQSPINRYCGAFFHIFYLDFPILLYISSVSSFLIMYVCLFHEKYNNPSYKNFRYRLLKGGYILPYQFYASSFSSSSSSSAPTSSVSAISSAGSSSVKSSNVSGASTIATVVSSSSIIVY